MLLLILSFTLLISSLSLTDVSENVFERPKDLEISSFQWNNCDSPKSGWTVVNSLSITPSPIPLGGDIVVQADVTVGSTISNTTWKNVGLTIETKTFGVWVEIPCFAGIGSCTYQGPALCGQLEQHADKNCPKLLPNGIPCRCPFAAGKFHTPAGGLKVHIKNPGYSWLTDGDFYIKAQLQGTSGELACVEIYFSLASV